MFNSHIKSVTFLTLYFPKVIFKSVTLLTLYFLTNNIYIYINITFIPLLHLHPLPHHCAYSIGEDEATACRLRAILDPRSSFLLSHCDSFLDPRSQYRLVFPAVKQRFVRSIHQFFTLMNVHPVLSPLQTQQR